MILNTKIAKSKLFWALLILLLSLPAFFRMLKPGIFTMHDFHVFRLHEYHLCILDGIFPCRWAPDSTWQYGQPLFNFYGQPPYILGEPFQLLGIQTIDTIKILFIFSLVGSGCTMFLLARQLWKNNLAALVSSLIYIYAPYRAVDVWVRGALPEALSFALFPLIIYFLNKFIRHSDFPPQTVCRPESNLSKLKKAGQRIPFGITPCLVLNPSLLLFSLSLALLIITHNLSTIMFLFFAAPWGLYLLIREKKFALILPLGLAGIFSLLLSAFYLIPVVLETHLVTLNQTTVGYYNYQAHFTTLTQLLISRFWGYGASLWGPVDDLSLSIGQLQWLIPTILVIYLASKYLLLPAIDKSSPKRHLFPILKSIPILLLNSDSWILDSLVLTILGWFALFLTHGRSLLLWKLLSPLTFVQFPWRFLSVATFSFSLAAGGFIVAFGTTKGSNLVKTSSYPLLRSLLKPKRLSLIFSALLILSVILLNQQFFRPDIWRSITDKQQFTGPLWEEQVASAISDFWPKTAPLVPHSFAPRDPIIQPPTAGTGQQISKYSHSAQYLLNLTRPATVQFPIVYFPGWIATTNHQNIPTSPSGDFGLITSQLPAGIYQVNLQFTDTPPRTAGNLTSLISLIFITTVLILQPKLLKPKSKTQQYPIDT